MKSPLPGLPTMAALMLSTLIVAWLGLWGPVNLERLKDWQTLMAAIIALGAATLAYRGAMAKVDHDRKESERRRNSERLGLFLRLNSSLVRVLMDIRRCIDMFEVVLPQPGGTPLQATIDAEVMGVYNPPELLEAWGKIDLFPASLVIDIEVLSRLLPTIEAEIAQSKGKNFIVTFEGDVRRADMPLELHLARCRLLEPSCRTVIRGLNDVIPPLRRFE